jgi:hypothetical protein
MTADLQCSFCGKGRSEARCLIRGPGNICICDACAWLCADILIEHGHPAPEEMTSTMRAHLQRTRAEADRVRGLADELLTKLEPVEPEPAEKPKP